MGIFDSIAKSFNEGRQKARDEAYRRNEFKFPIELVEPSSGRIVELRVTEEREHLSKMYIEQITTYAQGLAASQGLKWDVNGKTVKLIFSDGDSAQKTREFWASKSKK